jgi:hypothetical protein
VQGGRGAENSATILVNGRTIFRSGRKVNRFLTLLWPINDAEGGSRTHTTFRATDFKSVGIAIDSLLDKLERYDLRERTETLKYLKHPLNGTRSLFRAEAAHSED